MAITARLALMLFAGAIAAQWPNAAVSRPSSPKVLTETSANSVTKVSVGESVEIRLKAQPGTGFSWVPRKSASMVKPLPPLRPARMVPGGAQLQRFRFKSRSTGIYIVSFYYDQPWRGGTKKAKTRSFTMVVR